MSFSFSLPSQPATSAKPATSSFSFGTPATSTSNPAPGITNPSTPSLSFGAKPSTTTNSFGSTGATTTTNAGGLSGFSLQAQTNLPQQQQQQQQPLQLQSQQQSQQNLASQQITGKTKFTELNQAIQQELLKVEEYINSQRRLCDFISSQKTQDLVDRINKEITELGQSLSTLSTVLQRSSTQIETLRKTVQSELRNAEVATRIVDMIRSGFTATSNISAPRSGINDGLGFGFGYGLSDYYSGNEYFWNLMNSFENRMNQMRQKIEELERNIPTPSRSSNAQTPQALNTVMRNQYDSFLVLASNLAKIHESVKELQMNWENVTGKTVTGRRTEDTSSLAKEAQTYLAPSIMSTPTQQPQQATSGFGTSTFGAKPSGFGLGSSTGLGASTPATGLSFGGGASTGLGATTSGTGLSFGTGLGTSTAATGTTGFGLGSTSFSKPATSMPTTTSSFSLGQPPGKTQTAPSFSFGGTSTAGQSTGFGTGTPTGQTTLGGTTGSTGLGGGTTTGGFSFGGFGKK